MPGTPPIEMPPGARLVASGGPGEAAAWARERGSVRATRAGSFVVGTVRPRTRPADRFP